MPGQRNFAPWFRVFGRPALVIAGVVLVAGAFLLALPARTPPDLSEQDRAEIAAVVDREMAAPLGSMTPKSDGTVQVFVGNPDQLGGQLVQVQRHQGSWRVMQVTLLY